MSAAVKRIKKELDDIKKAKSTNFTVVTDKDNLFKWEVTINGPPDTPYEGGRFKLDVTLPDTYPFRPPAIKFITKVYHTNISENGGICLDILANNWSAALTMSKVLLSLVSFLENASSNHGLRPGVYTEYTQNRELYNKNVREQTRLYAMGHLTEEEKDAIQNKGKAPTKEETQVDNQQTNQTETETQQANQTETDTLQTNETETDTEQKNETEIRQTTDDNQEN